MGHLLPSGVGGDAARAYVLAQRTARGAEAIGLVVVDRYVGICSLALLAATGLVFWSNQAVPELQQVSAAAVADTFYRSFRERRLTAFGASRRRRVEQSRLALLHRFAGPPGDLVEIGPGDGSLAARAVEAGWRYRAVEASPALAADLRAHGFAVTEAWAPPIPAEDASCDVIYADQVLEHMAGIDAARAFVAEGLRALRPGGVLFVVVPDYLKERAFFWDIDYTHNFVTTERRVRQLLYDGGFEIAATVRSIGAATGLRRDALAAGALLVNLPGVDAVSRWTRTEELLFRVRKNLFETLAFVARRPAA